MDDWAQTRLAELHALVAEAIAICPSQQGMNSISIETTRDEIVDVRNLPSEGAACVEDAIWSIRLPPSFDRMASFEIDF